MKKPYKIEYQYDPDTNMVNVIKTWLKRDTRTDQERSRDAELDSRCNQYNNVQDNVPSGKRVC